MDKARLARARSDAQRAEDSGLERHEHDECGTREVRQDPGLRRRTATTSSASAPISRSCTARSTASLSSISTTAPRRRSRSPSSRPWTTPIASSTPTCIAACTISPTRRRSSFEEARETVRRFLNAASTDEIIFTRNATEAINLVASSWGGMKIGEGDEIVLSIMEHHSNIVPWHFHRERRGAVLKWMPISDKRRVPDRRVRAPAHAQDQDRRRSRTCRTCSAPWCR